MTALSATAKTTASPVADWHVESAQVRIEEAVTGLRKLADLVADRPGIAEAVSAGLARRDSNRILLYVNDGRAGGVSIAEYIADVATAASRHGAEVCTFHSNGYGGINAHFGFVTLHVYAALADVGAVAIHTRSVQVTDWQPDPALAGIAAG
jgi:hypothetical protein